ncbi:MAG: restriction endonuclease, partial [Enterobacter roggenkampii]|uniref:restriction endonuclease n=2 Tax=Enterobacter roggenkampii TaxID=1812935 RepID=UPI001EDB65D0
RCVCGKKIGPDPRNFNQRVSLGRNDLLIRTFPKRTQDQGADLFVTRFGKDMVIQAKNYSGSVGNSAVQQVISAKTFYGCDEAMVVTNSYFTRSAKELAESALVRLIDRDELQKYLDDYNQKIIEDFQSNS